MVSKYARTLGVRLTLVRAQTQPRAQAAIPPIMTAQALLRQVTIQPQEVARRPR